jgi:hypothetical protein
MFDPSFVRLCPAFSFALFLLDRRHSGESALVSAPSERLTPKEVPNQGLECGDKKVKALAWQCPKVSNEVLMVVRKEILANLENVEKILY